MDMLTTDGSFANQFDFFDSDSKEKSALKTTLKLTSEIAPLLIPGVNVYYAGVKTAIGLASVMPTFYKALEGMLLGDSYDPRQGVATAAEGYMAKFAASSVSDEAQQSMFNYEQMGQMVADIFSQIYEQRAMASLSKYIVRANSKISAKQKELLKTLNKDITNGVLNGRIDINDVGELLQSAVSKVPELQSVLKLQSGVSKSLSLGYMALTSTANIYGDAIQGGYDRRTAGFAALAAAAGQYGVMMNNRMGDWFLDKTTGYNVHTNNVLIRNSTKEYLEQIKKAFSLKTQAETKKSLAATFRSMKQKLNDTFTSSSGIGEAMIKNAFIEGVEEVTEQLVMDATTGIVDAMSYLGLTKNKGSFNTVSNVFSEKGLENYMANLLGGILGGAMFEFHRSRLEP
jgi:hypothetical protein